MTSRSTAKKMVRPASKPVSKSAPKKPKAKLAKVTKFPTARMKKPLPAAKKVAPPPPQTPARKSDPPPRGMPALTPPKQVQEPKQSLARSFYWSELRVGDDLPPLTKPAIDRVQIARYAASSGDFNRLHLDEPYAHAVGFPGLFAPGMLAMAFVGQLLTSWLRRGHVRKLGARFIKIVWPADELTCRGRIAELRKETGACYADVELWAENQKGELVLRGQATCELYVSPQNGGADSGGLLFALQNGGPTLPQVSPRTPSSSPPSKPPKKK
ncbi:MAG: MaoC/PaaZ C-terminal domain-containing protein [Myxococcales bacterium]